MSTLATIEPQRRGICPGLSAPMATGDGLLVRLLPRGAIPLAAFAALCRAARECGNGIIEITSRGSIQIRGLNETSASRFAETITALDIAAEDGVPILCNPLCGLDPEEIFDCTSLAEELRQRIVQSGLAAQLSPKVSVIIDGGGALSLDAMAADIRLRARNMRGNAVFDVSVGGDNAGVFKLGQIEPRHGAETVLALLDVIARYGRAIRARDLLASRGEPLFRSAIAELLLSACRHENGDSKTDSRLSGNEQNAAVGTFALRDEKIAAGIGLAFGHADADAMERLVEAAQTLGATGLRTAPERTLLAIGLTRDSAAPFAAQAERLGFISCADDPRRKIIACAGAPVCASAQIASRALAPAIATGAPAQFTGMIHLSGCGKGCAHAGNAALTVVGLPEGCALIANGSVRDTPFAVVPESKLHAAIKDYVRHHSREAAHV
jgi:precorrin-3B synthase